MQKKLKIYTILLVNFIHFLWPFEILAYVPVSTEIDTIVLKKDVKLFMPSRFTAKCLSDHKKNRDIFCFPKTNLYLLVKSKRYDLSKLIYQWDDSNFVHFVKISSNKYFEDLNLDGFSEVAIFPMVAGNSPVGSAIIYSVKKNKLVHYGLGDFFWENGKHVINIKKGKKWK